MRMIAATAAFLVAACAGEETTPHDRGRLLLRQFGCGGCHSIPGVANAKGRSGPPLANLRDRAYLGGVLPNDPGNLVQWIRDPQRFDPRTSMPAMGMTEAQARDMAAYLLEAK